MTPIMQLYFSLDPYYFYIIVPITLLYNFYPYLLIHGFITNNFLFYNKIPMLNSIYY